MVLKALRRRRKGPVRPTPASAAAPALLPGELAADRYRIEAQLGSGGMAVVYRAYDLELEESVALKFLRADREGGQDVPRLKQEIKLARRIVHTNVCRTFDLGTWGDVRFVTMELLEGEILDRWLAGSKRIDLAERVCLFRGILSGLRAAHQVGIVHRDLKPQNVMVTRSGRPVIMDFGIAAEAAVAYDLSRDGTYGTPAYMAPERMTDRHVDHRSDLYSLGVILFELATGQVPFRSSDPESTLRQQLDETAPRPRETNERVPQWLELVILRLLEKNPDRRYQSAGDLLADLPEIEGPRRRSVLLVDDDQVILKLLATRLQGEEVSVHTARDGAEGLEAALSESPDLICVDLNMPLMDGFNFLSYLQRQGGLDRIPVFMWTAVDDPQYERQALRLGIEKFFRKPLDVSEVVSEIAERLATVF